MAGETGPLPAELMGLPEWSRDPKITRYEEKDIDKAWEEALTDKSVEEQAHEDARRRQDVEPLRQELAHIKEEYQKNQQDQVFLADLRNLGEVINVTIDEYKQHRTEILKDKNIKLNKRMLDAAHLDFTTLQDLQKLQDQVNGIIGVITNGAPESSTPVKPQPENQPTPESKPKPEAKPDQKDQPKQNPEAQPEQKTAPEKTKKPKVGVEATYIDENKKEQKVTLEMLGWFQPGSLVDCYQSQDDSIIKPGVYKLVSSSGRLELQTADVPAMDSDPNSKPDEEYLPKTIGKIDSIQVITTDASETRTEQILKNQEYDVKIVVDRKEYFFIRGGGGEGIDWNAKRRKEKDAAQAERKRLEESLATAERTVNFEKLQYMQRHLADIVSHVEIVTKADANGKLDFQATDNLSTEMQRSQVRGRLTELNARLKDLEAKKETIAKQLKEAEKAANDKAGNGEKLTDEEKNELTELRAQVTALELQQKKLQDTISLGAGKLTFGDKLHYQERFQALNDEYTSIEEAFHPKQGDGLYERSNKISQELQALSDRINEINIQPGASEDANLQAEKEKLQKELVELMVQDKQIQEAIYTKQKRQKELSEQITTCQKIIDSYGDKAGYENRQYGDYQEALAGEIIAISEQVAFYGKKENYNNLSNSEKDAYQVLREQLNLAISVQLEHQAVSAYGDFEKRINETGHSYVDDKNQPIDLRSLETGRELSLMEKINEIGDKIAAAQKRLEQIDAGTYYERFVKERKQINQDLDRYIAEDARLRAVLKKEEEAPRRLMMLRLIFQTQARSRVEKEDAARTELGIHYDVNNNEFFSYDLVNAFSIILKDDETKRQLFSGITGGDALIHCISERVGEIKDAAEKVSNRGVGIGRKVNVLRDREVASTFIDKAYYGVTGDDGIYENQLGSKMMQYSQHNLLRAKYHLMGALEEKAKVDIDLAAGVYPPEFTSDEIALYEDGKGKLFAKAFSQMEKYNAEYKSLKERYDSGREAEMIRLSLEQMVDALKKSGGSPEEIKALEQRALIEEQDVQSRLEKGLAAVIDRRNYWQMQMETTGDAYQQYAALQAEMNGIERTKSLEIMALLKQIAEHQAECVKLGNDHEIKIGHLNDSGSKDARGLEQDREAIDADYRNKINTHRAKIIELQQEITKIQKFYESGNVNPDKPPSPDELNLTEDQWHMFQFIIGQRKLEAKDEDFTAMLAGSEEYRLIAQSLKNCHIDYANSGGDISLEDYMKAHHAEIVRRTMAVRSGYMLDELPMVINPEACKNDGSQFCKLYTDVYQKIQNYGVATLINHYRQLDRKDTARLDNYREQMALAEKHFAIQRQFVDRVTKTWDTVMAGLFNNRNMSLNSGTLFLDEYFGRADEGSKGVYAGICNAENLAVHDAQNTLYGTGKFDAERQQFEHNTDLQNIVQLCVAELRNPRSQFWAGETNTSQKDGVRQLVHRMFMIYRAGQGRDTIGQESQEQQGFDEQLVLIKIARDDLVRKYAVEAYGIWFTALKNKQWDKLTDSGLLMSLTYALVRGKNGQYRNMLDSIDLDKIIHEIRDQIDKYYPEEDSDSKQKYEAIQSQIYLKELQMRNAANDVERLQIEDEIKELRKQVGSLGKRYDQLSSLELLADRVERHQRCNEARYPYGTKEQRNEHIDKLKRAHEKNESKYRDDVERAKREQMWQELQGPGIMKALKRWWVGKPEQPPVSEQSKIVKFKYVYSVQDYIVEIKKISPNLSQEAIDRIVEKGRAAGDVGDGPTKKVSVIDNTEIKPEPLVEPVKLSLKRDYRYKGDKDAPTPDMYLNMPPELRAPAADWRDARRAFGEIMAMCAEPIGDDLIKDGEKLVEAINKINTNFSRIACIALADDETTMAVFENAGANIDGIRDVLSSATKEDLQNMGLAPDQIGEIMRTLDKSTVRYNYMREMAISAYCGWIERVLHKVGGERPIRLIQDGKITVDGQNYSSEFRGVLSTIYDALGDLGSNARNKGIYNEQIINILDQNAEFYMGPEQEVNEPSVYGNEAYAFRLIDFLAGSFGQYLKIYAGKVVGYVDAHGDLFCTWDEDRKVMVPIKGKKFPPDILRQLREPLTESDG